VKRSSTQVKAANWVKLQPSLFKFAVATEHKQRKHMPEALILYWLLLIIDPIIGTTLL